MKKKTYRDKMSELRKRRRNSVNTFVQYKYIYILFNRSKIINGDTKIQRNYLKWWRKNQFHCYFWSVLYISNDVEGQRNLFIRTHPHIKSHTHTHSGILDRICFEFVYDCDLSPFRCLPINRAIYLWPVKQLIKAKCEYLNVSACMCVCVCMTVLIVVIADL